MPEHPRVYDDGNSSRPFDGAAGMIAGFAIGCNARTRIGIVLRGFGFHAQTSALWSNGASVSDVLASALAEDEMRAHRAVRELSDDGRWHVRAELAGALPHYVKTVFEKLAVDVVSVQQSLAANPHAPQSLKDRLNVGLEEVKRLTAT